MTARPVFRFLRAAPQEPLPSRPFHRIVSPGGRPWTLVHREAAGYRLRFPGLADFTVAADGAHARCRPVAGTSRAVCEHLFLNQVRPLMLSHRGHLVFHASAVAAHGGAIAFLGASGRGKSTLAAAFATAGQPFLTDEDLVLDLRHGGYRVRASHPSLRLWDDSRRALLGNRGRAVAALPFTDKTRLASGTALPHGSRPRRLLCAYVLGTGRARQPSIRPIAANASVKEWLRNAFLLDPGDKVRLVTHFRNTADLAARVACFRLDFPRRFGVLPRVRQCVLEHLERQFPG